MLAALYFNENTSRLQAERKADGGETLQNCIPQVQER